MLSLDIICPHTLIGFYRQQLWRMTARFLVFFVTNFLEEKIYLPSEHMLLFIPIEFYFTKRHVWRVKMFHKIVHMAWNLFKHLEQLSKNSAKNLALWVSIDQKKSGINGGYFRSIEQESRINRTRPRLQNNFPPYFDWSSKNFNRLKILNFEFLLEYSKTWIFTLWNNILQTETSLLQSINVYTHTYIYTHTTISPCLIFKESFNRWMLWSLPHISGKNLSKLHYHH